MNRKRKLCACGKPSVPGLKPGKALCQYHFTKMVWGAEWAKRCEPATQPKGALKEIK